MGHKWVSQGLEPISTRLVTTLAKAVGTIHTFLPCIRLLLVTWQGIIWREYNMRESEEDRQKCLAPCGGKPD
jgi:hypothetical protein